MTENYFRTPLQVMRAVTDAAGVLTVYLLSPTGGVVQGDRYDIAVRLGAGAHALVTTQAATKVYRMPDDGAVQCMTVELLPGAVLELLPDVLILFAGADYTQELHITLHSGALLVMQEIVMPGRLARGESLAFKRYRSRVIVRDSHGLLLYDSVDYTPQPGDAGQLGLFDDAGPCWGTWYLLGDAAAWGEVSPAAFCAAHHAAISAWPGALGGLSALHRDGVSARLLARTVAPLHAAFAALSGAARVALLGLPASAIRR